MEQIHTAQIWQYVYWFHLPLELVSTITMSFFSFMCIRPDCSLLSSVVGDDDGNEDGTGSLEPATKHTYTVTHSWPHPL